MEKDLPKDLLNAIELLEQSFKPEIHIERVRMFKDGIYVLNDCLDDFPVFAPDVRDIKLSYTIKLMCRLKSILPDPDYQTWLEYTLLLCIDLKHEVKRLYLKDPALFEDFLEFLSLYSEKVTPQLTENISNFLKEITD